ncbi:hypothetical protein B0H13DRAFT_2365745 [Mycena leptocephala]|nr:hypothetical protein B0H13DRAFT_2365745 [Mycena leptocephala]
MVLSQNSSTERTKRVCYPPLKGGTSGASNQKGLIIHIPKDPVAPLGQMRRPQVGAPSKPKFKSVLEAPIADADPEKGWDAETMTDAVVKDITGAQINRRAWQEHLHTSRADHDSGIAFTAQMFSPTLTAERQWSFERAFRDGDFTAAVRS